MTSRARPVAAILLFVVLPARPQSQAASPKTAFVDALGRFSLALDGQLGDEGPTVLAALDDMQRALAAWDAQIRSYEAARAAERPTASPALMARMHRALGGVYLDRGRLADAIRELEAARALEPAAGDTHSLLTIAHARAGNMVAATAAARRAGAAAAGDPARVYLAGRALDRAGDPAGERLLRTFVALERLPAAAPFVDAGLVPERTGVEPYLPLVSYAAGFALLHTGDYAAAIARFRAAAATDPLVARPPAADDPLRGASAAVRAGSAGAARRALTALLQRSPDRLDARRLLAFVDAADGQIDRAIETLRRAVATHPADERTHLALAQALVDADRQADAEVALAAALTALPGSGRARYLRGRLHQRQGRYVEAIADLEAVAAMHPLLGANGVFDTIGDLASAQQDFGAAAAAHHRRIDVHPNDAAAHADLGRALMQLVRHPQALAEFAVAVMIDPADASSHSAMAQIHLRDGEFEAAARAARTALAVDPTSIEAQYVLATALIRGGNAEAGRQELEHYQQLQAADTADRERIFEQERLRREATVAAAAGDHDTAIAHRRRIVELSPRSGAARFELGTTLMTARDFAGAIEALTAAVTLGAPPDAHGRLADAYEALGRTADAGRARADYDRVKAEALRAKVRR